MILQTIPFFDLPNLLYNISIINLDNSIITIIEIFILGGMVLLSGKAIQMGLDMGAKAVAIVAGSTMIYKNLKGSGSGSGSDDNDKDKDKKDENKKDENKKDEDKKDDSTSDSKSN
jgi:hypothetical protein